MSTAGNLPDLERDETPRMSPEHESWAVHRCSGRWKSSWERAISPFRLWLWPDVPKDDLQSLIDHLKGSLLKEGQKLPGVFERQCCFLCLRCENDYYALRVPCIGQRPVGPKEKGFECDAAIWERMREAYFNDKGRWKMWLPFFGPTAVREVEFQFVGIKVEHGRLPIFGVNRVDIEKVREEADRVIALQPDEFDIDYGNECGPPFHSTKCQANVDPFLPCIMELVEAATQRKRKLDMLDELKKCARDPCIANGRGTLDGMAQESCVYNLQGYPQLILPQRYQSYDRTDKLRGIELVMGWQFDLMFFKIPKGIAWVMFSLAVIWLCVLVWERRTSNWDAALAFGQLIAASVTLVFLYTKD